MGPLEPYSTCQFEAAHNARAAIPAIIPFESVEMVIVSGLSEKSDGLQCSSVLSFEGYWKSVGDHFRSQYRLCRSAPTCKDTGGIERNDRMAEGRVPLKRPEKRKEERTN